MFRSVKADSLPASGSFRQQPRRISWPTSQIKSQLRPGRHYILQKSAARWRKDLREHAQAARGQIGILKEIGHATSFLNCFFYYKEE
jgi:hypothetical protein